jgi:hypothetical protein
VIRLPRRGGTEGLSDGSAFPRVGGHAEWKSVQYAACVGANIAIGAVGIAGAAGSDNEYGLHTDAECGA